MMGSLFFSSDFFYSRTRSAVQSHFRFFSPLAGGGGGTPVQPTQKNMTGCHYFT